MQLAIEQFGVTDPILFALNDILNYHWIQSVFICIQAWPDIAVVVP